MILIDSQKNFPCFKFVCSVDILQISDEFYRIWQGFELHVKLHLQ